MKVLALDLSTKSTGWAVFEETQLKDWGCITASSTQVIVRIRKITSEIEKILDMYPDIDTIVIEEVRPENNQRGAGNIHTHRVLMWLQGQINFLLFDARPKAKIEYIYPSEWRARCGIKNGRGIKRDEEKKRDVDFVKQTYQIDVNDDIADAIGIGHAFVNDVKTELNWE